MKKRLIIDLLPAEHKALARRALELDTTISNLVRRALGLPEVQRGVKREPARRGKGRAK